jgi:hypothetical protein
MDEHFNEWMDKCVCGMESGKKMEIMDGKRNVLLWRATALELDKMHRNDLENKP